MPERSVGSANYRYAFNGMELDNEVSGNGNSYTTEFRQYDPRLGRWKSLDPLMSKYPGMSPYVSFNNNPNMFIDPDGREGQDWVRGGTSADGKKSYDDNVWHWEASVSSKGEADAIGANDWIGKDDSRTITAVGGKKVTLSYDAFMDKGKVTWQNTTETPEAGISPFLWSQVNEFSWMGGAITNPYAGMNFLGNNFSRESLGWGARSGWEAVANLSSYVAYGSVAFATGGSMAPIFSGGGGVEMLNMGGKFLAKPFVGLTSGNTAIQLTSLYQVGNAVADVTVQTTNILIDPNLSASDYNIGSTFGALYFKSSWAGGLFGAANSYLKGDSKGQIVSNYIVNGLSGGLSKKIGGSRLLKNPFTQHAWGSSVAPLLIGSGNTGLNPYNR